jgi:hypothetical protein
MGGMDTRQLKARQIVATGNITEGTGCYYVPSQSKGARYRVELGGLFPNCSCDDFELTGTNCKHMLAVKQWLAEKANTTPTVVQPPPEHIPRKTYAQPDWRAYTLAQTREKGHFCELLADLCSSIPEPTPKGGSKGGRPAVPLRDAVFASVFRVYCGFSARRFTCDLRDAAQRGYLHKPIGHTSVIKAMESEALTPILTDLIGRSAAPLRAVESCFAVDSSGFCTNTYTRWFDVKWGQKEQQTWVKAHIAVGVTTNVVAAVEIFEKRTHDCNILPLLVDTVAKRFDVREVSADKAYTSGPNFEAVAKHGGTLFAAFKSNTTGGIGGLFEQMWHRFSANREEYLTHYHKRSNVESTFSMVKRVFGEHVRSKTDTAQKNEVLCKFVAHNARCLIHAMYELGISPFDSGRDEDGPRAVIKFPGVA